MYYCNKVGIRIEYKFFVLNELRQGCRGSRCGGVWGLGVVGGVSRCHSIDRLPKLWLLHLLYFSSNYLYPLFFVN